MLLKSLPNKNYKPAFFYLNNKASKEEIFNLLKNNPSIIILDEIYGQLEELIKLKNPKIKHTEESLSEEIDKHLDGTPIQDYGVWVYYSWSNRLVHLLDEREFVEVRTNRNQNKITLEEQNILQTKKIGVIGLSVGQSVALTLAMERAVGEISIADYDILELSNLNRIRTGVHTLNLPKTVAVAREIAEIDPFIKVNCFHEGITEDNIEDFLLKGKKLDILIDECDGLDIKFLCRTKAKEYQIPVLMDTSDRGMLDVERFDLEPNRSIFHGLVDHMDTSKIKEAKTNEEKVPYVLAIIGWETISDKMKASMVEIEETVSTWPQLASAVAMGGGMTCDVSRRILLDQFHDSGRYFVDVEEIITDKSINKNVLGDNSDEIEDVVDSNQNELTEEIMRKMALDCLNPEDLSRSYKISNDTVEQLISKAILAPTGGNSQPWKWLFLNNQLFLFHDKGKSTQFLDFKGFGAYVGLGAAMENLTLEAHKQNIEVESNTFPIDGNRQLVAKITFSHLEVNHNYDYLVDYLGERCTDRNIYASENIEEDVIKSLRDACSSISGATLQLISNEKDVKKYGDLLGRSDKLLLTTKKTHAEFMNEIRWSSEEVQNTRSGVDIETIDLTATEVAGFKVIKNWSVVKYLNKWGGGSAFEKLSKKCAENAYSLGMITVPGLTPSNFFDGGKAMQRVWLEATKQNLNIHPLCALNYMFIRLKEGKGEGMDDRMIKELELLRKEHETIFGSNNDIGVFFFRVFKGNKPNKKSLRRYLDDVLVIK